MIDVIVEMRGDAWINTCLFCRLEHPVTTANYEEFCLTWYESLTWNLCPVCKNTPEGIERIARDREHRKTSRANLEKRLMRNHEISH